jgi:hypothetical protein
MVDQNPSFSDQVLTRQRRYDEADMPSLPYSLRDPNRAFVHHSPRAKLMRVRSSALNW